MSSRTGDASCCSAMSDADRLAGLDVDPDVMLYHWRAGDLPRRNHRGSWPGTGIREDTAAGRPRSRPPGTSWDGSASIPAGEVRPGRSEQQGVQERRTAVPLDEVIAADGVGQWPGDVDPQVRGHGQHSGMEGLVVAGAGGQAVPRVQALGGRADLLRLDVAGQQHPPGAERRRIQASEDTLAAAVVQHIQREYVLPYAGRGQDDPFGILLG